MSGLIAMVRQAVDLFLHLDKHLNVWAAQLGPWLYAFLFAVIFCETGLVVAPYLPGDSLLFAIGAMTAMDGSPISLAPTALLLCVAAVLGDAVNYAIGRALGPKIFSREDSWLLNKKHLSEAQQFYDTYGAKTIVIARFVPIVRTFAPFVAGIGKMHYPRFALYNIVGGISWVLLFLVAGNRFADLPIVKKQFHYVILAIIAISLLPILVEYLKAHRNKSPLPQ
ncbi:MAG: DedA family protein [Elusimicrobia bacterium]|nr:DedA family protein [Elusimicrobiota bacterium]